MLARDEARLAMAGSSPTAGSLSSTPGGRTHSPLANLYASTPRDLMRDGNSAQYVSGGKDTPPRARSPSPPPPHVPVAERVVCVANLRVLAEQVKALTAQSCEQQHRLNELTGSAVRRKEFEAIVDLKEDRGVTTAGLKQFHRTMDTKMGTMCSKEDIEEKLLRKIDAKSFKTRVFGAVQLDLKRLFDTEMGHQVEHLRAEAPHPL